MIAPHNSDASDEKGDIVCDFKRINAREGLY